MHSFARRAAKLWACGLLSTFGARSAYTWTGATWALTGGRAYNTPTLGSELLTDGGLENWNSATDLASWTEVKGGTSALDRESSIVNSGTYAAKLTVDGGGNNVYLRQDALTVGQWLQMIANARVDSASATLRIGDLSTTYRDVTLTTAYQTFTVSGRAANVGALFGRGSATGRIIYCDDLSAKNLSTSSLFATQVSGANALTVSAKPYAIAAGTQAGVVSHLDSTSNPQNFIIAYHDGGTSIRMDKCVGGTYTSLVSATTAFVSDAVIEIRSTGSNQFECWYNGSKRGLTATVSDAGIVSNTRYGLFSTYSANLFHSEGLTLGGVLIPFGF